MGVKLSEAQAYLVKPSEKIHMVVCDGFNCKKDNLQEGENTKKLLKGKIFAESVEAYESIIKLFILPMISKYCVDLLIHIIIDSKGYDKILKLNQTRNANLNYDNLRNIDSDDSMITSPEKNLQNHKNLHSENSDLGVKVAITDKNLIEIMKPKPNITSFSEIIDRNGKVSVLYEILLFYSLFFSTKHDFFTYNFFLYR